jgi:DivIVA domain-containing protein
MALDRQSIEKRDFPIGRRGYDPEAVDAHLAEVANEVDGLELSARRHTESLASSASEQVRGIIEAAEASATEILRQSENDAREIRAEADQEAQSARADATAQSRDHVGRVSAATAAMLQRLNAMDSELSALIDGLRTGANRLNADLQLLEGNFDGVRESLDPRAQFENGPSPSAAGLAGAGGGSQISDGAGAAAAEAAPEVDPGPEVAADIDGARLVALNMALNGTPRDETDRYLSENFELDERQLLLDEVYSSVAD